MGVDGRGREVYIEGGEFNDWWGFDDDIDGIFYYWWIFEGKYGYGWVRELKLYWELL